MHKHENKAIGIMMNLGNNICTKGIQHASRNWLKEMKIQELPNKEFKTTVPQMIRDLQENTDKKVNVSGKKYKNKIRSSTERQKTKEKPKPILKLNTMTVLKNSK